MTIAAEQNKISGQKNWSKPSTEINVIKINERIFAVKSWLSLTLGAIKPMVLYHSLPIYAYEYLTLSVMKPTGGSVPLFVNPRIQIPCQFPHTNSSPWVPWSPREVLYRFLPIPAYEYRKWSQNPPYVAGQRRPSHSPEIFSFLFLNVYE